MGKVIQQLPSDYLRSVNADVADGFKALREAVRQAGPLDVQTRELVLVAAFATAGNEVAVRAHTEVALNLGVTQEALVHAILLTLGATNTLINTTNALQWIQESVALLRQS